MSKYMLTYIFSFFAISTYTQEMNIVPAMPSAGSEIELTYNPQDGPLKNQGANAIIYSIELGQEPIAHEVMLKNGIGKFAIPKNAHALWINFANEDESIMDKKNDLGYPSLLYDNNKPIENSNAALASVYTYYSYHVRIERNMEAGDRYLAEEISVYPDQASNFEFYKLKYWVDLSIAKDKGVVEDQIRTKIHAIRNQSEKDLDNAVWLAQHIDDTSLVVDLQNQAIKNYPAGKTALDVRLDNFKNKKTHAEREAEYQGIKKLHSEDEIQEGKLDYVTRQIVAAYGKEANEEKFYQYANAIQSPNTVASVCNDLAWKFSGETLDAEGTHLEFAEKISKWSLELIEKAKTGKKAMPKYFTSKRWEKNMEALYGMFSDTYALIAYKLGDVDSSVKYQHIAVEDAEYEDADMNTRYTAFLEKRDGPEAALPILEKLISYGKASTEMKDQFRRIHKSTQTDSDVEERLASMEKVAKDKLAKEIEEKFVQKDKIPFSLLNLKGQTVSLADMAGKVIVLDFWATWCGPCITSFPGMQKAVDQFANNNKVEFLFVNTWENGENKAETAIDFIKEKGYNFHVLLDKENEVVKQYGVDGIPTKFVLDHTGKIRYESFGYGGNNSELVDELNIVVNTLLDEME